MILVNGNVERIAETPEKIEKLKSEGFKEMKVVLEESEKKMELDSLTVPELKKLAKENGIEGVSSLNKEELLTVFKELSDE